MDSFYFEQLPLDVQSIVLGIEAQIKREIKIEVQASELDVLACNVEGIYPKIIIPRGNFFPESSVLHELLHIHRFLVEEVPSLTVVERYWSKDLQNAFCSIDNDIEHLSIIPREIQMRPQRALSWRDKFESSLKKIEGLQIGSFNRIQFAMQAWININVVITDADLHWMCMSIIKSEGVEKKAGEFLLEVESKFNKVELCKTYVGHLNLTKYHPCIEYFSDSKKGMQLPL